MVGQDKRGVLIKDWKIAPTIGSSQLSENDKNQVRQANRPNVPTKGSGADPQEAIVDRLVRRSRQIPVEFHEEIMENGKLWRIFWVDPTVENNSDLANSSITAAMRDVGTALPAALEIWNSALLQFNIRFKIREGGIKVAIERENHQSEAKESAHNHVSSSRICIYQNFIEYADKLAACPKDTISGVLYSLRNGCLFGSRDSDRVSLYVKLLAHELGHEALENLTEPSGGLMRTDTLFENGSLAPVEAMAFARRVWKDGKKKSN